MGCDILGIPGLSGVGDGDEAREQDSRKDGIGGEE